MTEQSPENGAGEEPRAYKEFREQYLAPRLGITDREQQDAFIKEFGDMLGKRVVEEGLLRRPDENPYKAE